MQFIDLNAQYIRLRNNIDQRIKAVLEHGQYIMGPEVVELEERLADFVGVKHAISCANGTDAIVLSLMALGVKPGDAVFCPTFTFFATAEAIAFIGAEPVFVDVDPDTFNLCPRDLEAKIKCVLAENLHLPRAVIAVDLFGLPAAYDEISGVVDKYQLHLIEDAAQGLGGSVNGKLAGSFGDVATTSFFPAKPLGCYGDGGALFTNSDEIAELVRSLRVHGKGVDKYDNVRVGMNSRLDTIQAAILLEKLNVFAEELLLRQAVAERYHSLYSGIYKTPKIPIGYRSAWAQYTMVVTDRAEVIESFRSEGVPTAVYYERCMHQQTAFSLEGNRYVGGGFPVAERLTKTVLSLPMHPYLQIS